MSLWCKAVARHAELETSVNRSQAGSTASPKDIDEYIARFPDKVQALLRKVRSTIAAAAPGATESISYDMPTFDLNGRHLIHFGAYKKHIGLYPVATTHPELEEALRPYASGKGSARFPLNKAIPYGLITKIVAFKLKKSSREPARGSVDGQGMPAGNDESQTLQS